MSSEKTNVISLDASTVVRKTLFKELSGAIAFSQCNGVDKTIPQNVTIAREGDKIGRIYMVNEGLLRAFRVLPDGRRQITHFIFPRELIGIIDDEHYSSTIETIVTSNITSLSKIKFQECIVRDERIKQYSHAETKDSLRKANFIQLILGRLTPVEKLSCFIILLAQRSPNRGFVHIPMPRQDIADFLGLTVETVSRSFTRLRNLGLITSRDHSCIEIPSLSALHQVAGVNLS